MSYLLSTVIFFLSKGPALDNNKENLTYHALYTFPVLKFGIYITCNHHVPLCMIQQHTCKLLYHKFWSFQSLYLEIKCVIFLGKHTFHISCPKDRAVSHFLANVSMKVSKYLNGIWFWNLSTCCTDTQIKMIDTERFDNFGFCKTSRDGVSKSAKKDSVIKWFSKYFLTLFFKMMLWKPNLKIFTCHRKES